MKVGKQASDLKSIVAVLLALPSLALGQASEEGVVQNWPAPGFWQPAASEAASGNGRIAAKAGQVVDSTPLPFVALSPCRLADTRPENGFPAPYGPPSLSPNVTRDFPVAGQCGVPVGATAVSFNFTVVRTMGLGYLATYPEGESWPGTSTLNYIAGQIVANNAVVALGPSGALSAFVAGAQADLIIDINGYYGGTLVSSVNGLSGDVTLASGTNVTITPSGNTLTVSASSVPGPPGPQGPQGPQGTSVATSCAGRGSIALNAADLFDLRLVYTSESTGGENMFLTSFSGQNGSMPTTTASAFSSLELDPRLLSALTALGYEEPTPIQQQAIPPLLEGRDVLAQAATGTGKTAAFALPILHAIAAAPGKGESPVALILVPTRELAMQLAEAVHRYGKNVGVRVLPVYGGASMDSQLRALRRGVDVVVATPGRALDHVKRKTLRLEAVRTLVLDEADEMLDMGFAEDLEAILAATPADRQTALFSATLPPRIVTIASKHLKNPVRIAIGRETTAAGKLPKVRQTAYVVARGHKRAALGRVLDLESPTAALVFCRTRLEVDDLTESLKGRGLRVEALHGGISQTERDRVMKKLRAGTLELVVATDVAARGLDIGHLSHVVNYDVPSSPDHYVHRIGRTGRAGREGVAITLAEPREHWQLKNIERATRQKIEIGSVPTVADLRAKRLELTRASLRESLLAGGLDAYRVVVESLAEEFDPLDVAAAAVKLADPSAAGSGSAGEEHEIPSVAAPRQPAGPGKRATKSKPRAGAESSAKIFIGAGRADGVKPGDLVGAIVKLVKIPPREVGSIHIAERFCLVEVPEAIAEDVIRALRTAGVRGKKTTVRRDRDR